MKLRVTIAGLAVLVAVGGVACAMSENRGANPETEVADPYEPARQRMVTTQIEARGITLNALVRKARASQYAPQPIFTLDDGPKRYEVWLK